MLATTELSHLAERRPDELSGGQRQRVALARALVKQPRLLLLDEPLGALDKKLRGAMQLELKRLQHELGITFVVVTHDQEEALVMADRMAVLRDGKLLQCDTPHALYEHPSNRFAADFIGEMNFLDGVFIGGRLRVADIEIDGSVPADAAEGARITAAVRPERVVVFPPDDLPNRTAGQVVAAAYHGLDLQLHVLTPLSARPLLVRLPADAADQRPVAVGETIALGWSSRDTRMFID